MPKPGAHEVSVRVLAAGVNFRGVLQRIGLLPEEAFEAGFAGPTMGLEFAGEVVAAGENVEGLRPGDAVFGFGRNSFSSHIVAPAFCLFQKPASMRALPKPRRCRSPRSRCITRCIIWRGWQRASASSFTAQRAA